jgi:integrase
MRTGVENRSGEGVLRRRKYYLHTRKNGIYYAELVDPMTGRKLSARSTGVTDRDEAILMVARWLEKGIPSGRMRRTRPVALAFELDAILHAIRKTDMDPEGAESIIKALKDRGLITGNFTKTGPSAVRFIDFLENVWDMEKSAWLKEKSAYGHPLTKRHCIESLGVVRRYWDRPEICDTLLVDIDRTVIKSHLMKLHLEGLSPSTCNKALASISAPLAWAAREKIILESPAAGIPRFSGTPKKRDILTAAEIEKLKEFNWSDDRASVGFHVALTCGLRLSEVLAIRTEDVGEKYLSVKHSWSWADGLTVTKNKESRSLPLDPEVRDALRALVKTSPHKRGAQNFVFFGLNSDRPIDAKIITDGFIAALNGIGISEEERKRRNIVFHSLRHGFSTEAAERLPENLAMRLTGHKSSSVFRGYSNHETEAALETATEAMAGAFGKVVPFKASNDVCVVV